jgi:small-conductance mechanosensitive channel
MSCHFPSPLTHQPRPPTRISRWPALGGPCLRLGLLAWLWLLSLVTAVAQLPGMPGKTPSAAPATVAKPATESTAETKERLAKSLAETRAQLTTLEAAGSGTLPPGITAAEVADRRSDLIRAAFNLERHLKILETTDLMADSAKDAQRREKEWRGFEQPPPYSFLFYDELRNQRDSARARLEAFQSTVALVERQIASQQDEFRKAEEASRRAADEAARAKGRPDEAAALWRLEASNNHVLALGSAIAYYQVGVLGHQPRIATATAELALLDRQLAAVGDQVVFTDQDLATAAETTRTRIAAVEKEMVAITQRQNTVLTERNQARAGLEKLRQQPEAEPGKPRPEFTLAEARLRAAEAEAETLSFQMDILGSIIRLYSEWPAALGLRRQLFADPSSENREKARAELRVMSDRSRAWEIFIINERTAVAAAIREQESRLAGVSEDDPRRPIELRLLAAQWRRSETVERLDQQVSNASRSLERWLDDDQKRLARRSVGQRAGDWFARGWTAVKKVWQFEVYRYADTMEVNGETIVVKRGLSLGWLLGAVVFFLISYWLAGRLSRKIQRAAVHHGWTGEAQARTLRRWVMMAIGLVLMLITLHLLKIPLTAFAFLGGALAIGVGFGTQTLFKNFISGIIVLVERKVKVGDILDVDGIIGTVTTVDTRSSTLRGFDGVETLIPNSLLLENKVTNWTHTNARQRRLLRVGVAYGSPVQQVAEIMNECAMRHGRVLKDPPPLVLFEDFGADALLFGLYFWVELGERLNANQVASDLRFMLEKRFREAGIAIPFPQRDLHLNAGGPVKVEMVPPAPLPAD